MSALPQRDAAIFLAHYIDGVVARRFDKLRRECASRCDVFLLAEKGTAVPDRFIAQTRFFDFATARRMARSVIGDKVIPGNAHLRAIDFFHREPGYRYYWFIEFDVVYTGSWDALMASLATDDSDLIASRVTPIDASHAWFWQSSFQPGTDTVPADQKIRAFLPIFRISTAGLAAVDQCVSRGWTGHFEMLLPTAVAFNRLRVDDFGGSGSFTPSERRHRHYLDGEGLYETGTLRYHPPVHWPIIANMLYHPCKTRLASLRPRVRRRIWSDRLRRPGLFAKYLARVARMAVDSRLSGRSP
jgi:hypothetical protein